MGQADQSTLEANKEIVRQLGATNDASAWDRLDTLLTEDFRRHSVATTHRPEITSREEFKRHEQEIFELYPDRKVTYKMLVAEGDMVAAYASFSGTNKELGVRLETTYLAMLRIEDGRIAEIWIEWDNVDIYKQLGLWPPSQDG